MVALRYTWGDAGGQHAMDLVPVPGTTGEPYLFSAGANRRPIEIPGFHIGATPVTQALWLHVMGTNPSRNVAPRHPVENVSWHQVTGPDGFLARINQGPVRAALSQDRSLLFRLPSESEWEYAARGGPHWRDDFAFAGSSNPDDVAWYGPRWTRAHDLARQIFGWRFAWRVLGRRRLWMLGPRHTHAVATKKPNQLGIHDMSGNVWEWCEDTCTDDLDSVPADGTPWRGPGDEKRLRGGCHDNWDLHCRVWWRYGITPDAHDGCIGFRLVLARAGLPG